MAAPLFMGVDLSASCDKGAAIVQLEGLCDDDFLRLLAALDASVKGNNLKEWLYSKSVSVSSIIELHAALRTYLGDYGQVDPMQLEARLVDVVSSFFIVYKMVQMKRRTTSL